MVWLTPHPEPLHSVTRAKDEQTRRGKLQACVHVLKAMPKHVPLQLCVDCQLVTDRATPATIHHIQQH